jgi:hypothetical protein
MGDKRTRLELGKDDPCRQLPKILGPGTFSDFDRLEAFYRQRGDGQVVEETTGDLPMLVVDGTSKLVVFQIEDRLGGAMARQNVDVCRAAAVELAAAMRR